MKKIDKALAMSTGVLAHYTELANKLNDKMNYIEKIKTDRNTAQDELKQIYTLLGVTDQNSAITKLQNRD